ncbi:glycoside hydrolase family 5 protein [Phanerochaete carnosa HHB-10118-sp]|uniref:Glycoside hydrolase family 5 protein n=1 Tax=Phanerochaete carnosa (strain HHB-10118-sp) TaxID=650164 RepID=K5WE75_PHACS|nr:glycoside hydrolase family 5 protein [Phanerochaete carnosa HHB-10118-sp]EKM57334.1 glycoside hydrolase family 5 protein [Phanerochaete carnosa HHB-10118-sp]
MLRGKRHLALRIPKARRGDNGAGYAFAPKLRATNAHGTEVSVQQLLQASFPGSWKMLAKAVGDFDDRERTTDRNKNEGIVPRKDYFKKHPTTNEKVWHAGCAKSNTHQPFRMRNSFAQLRENRSIDRETWYMHRAGQQGARDKYALHTRNITEEVYRSLGEKLVVIGECGVPMDMNGEEAFKSEGFTWQLRMFDAMMGFTIWNYNPNSDDRKGDDWNGGNFTWFSQRRALPSSLLDCDRSSPTLDNGARILRSVVRPYLAKTAGIPLRFDYEVNTGEFTFK